MRTCPDCGASAAAAATWCGQCYTTLVGAQPLLAPAPAPAPSRFAPAPPMVVGAPAPPAPAGPLISRPGAVPSAVVSPAAPAAPAAPERDRDAAPHVLSRRALLLTVVAIGVGAIAMGVSTLLADDASLSPATYLRYALVLTLAVYAVVGVLVVTQITPSVRLRWSDGEPALGAAIGLLVGGGLSAALLAVVSATAGHLDPDPRIVTLMSEGDVAHVLATVLLTCAAAPLIEEVLFRGLLLESQRWRSSRGALAISAVAFAVWHLNPSALRYYALMGALLGWLYLRRGLVCSIAAHVAFNGVLTVAALSVVLTPGPSVDLQGLTVQTPAGWHRGTPRDVAASYAADNFAVFTGPSGAMLLVLPLPTPVAPNIDTIVDRLSAEGPVPQLLDRTSVRELRLPAGRALKLSGTSGAQRVTLVILPHAGHSYELVMNAAGSAKAERDFTRILQDLHTG